MSHVLITGGASGIGAGVALYLAENGVRVSILDRTGPDTVTWWNELSASVQGRWLVADAKNRADYVSALVSCALDNLTGLVTSAGISLKESFFDSSDESWDDSLTVNVMGTVLAIKEFARQIIDRGATGSVVTVASTVAYGAVAGLGAHYHASKGAIVALTRALASELGPQGIRVNSVAPGLVKTPLTQFMRDSMGESTLTSRVPLRDMADPEDVARAISFLLSTDSAMVTGQVIPVDAGQIMVSGQPPSGFPDPVVKASAPHAQGANFR